MIRYTIAALGLLVFACQPDGTSVNITIEGTGFEADSGYAAKLAVVRVDSDEIIAEEELIIGDDGLLRGFWRRRIADVADYRFDAFIDVDRNGQCDFGVDKTFSVDFEIGEENTGFTFFPRSGGDARGCLAFGGGTLSVRGSQFPPNKALYAALVRVTDNQVLDVVSEVTGDGAFELSWPGGIRPGQAYRVDWFVDTDASGTCDAGADEGPWSVTFDPVAGDPAGTGITGAAVRQDVSGGRAAEPLACDSFRGWDPL